MSNQQPEQTIQQPGLSEQKGLFTGQVIAHAAVNSGMMANFGRFFAKRLMEERVKLHFFAFRFPVFSWLTVVFEELFTQTQSCSVTLTLLSNRIGAFHP
jgi:hypothetical protein